MLRSWFIALALLFAAPAALAAEADLHAHPPEGGWSFSGPFGTFDRAAVQRGFKVYREVCSSCHGMDFLSYRNLGEPGGPFEAFAPADWQSAGVQPTLNPEGHGRRVNPNDNPYVRAIAAEFEITELDAQSGEEVTRPARPADRFRNPWPNEATARLANGGAYPPDLSVITKARHGGADYVYSLLAYGYDEPLPAGVAPQDGRYYNAYFPGGWIGMPPQLIEGQVQFDDGTPSTRQQMAKDVATFLAWAADPKQEARKQLGFIVMAYLLVLSALLYVAYRQVWRGVSH